MGYTPDVNSFDVVVLGGGSAGELIAEALAGAGRSVALVERHRVGGECPYVACMPSKAMLRSSEVRQLVRTSHELGAVAAPIQLDDDDSAFGAAVARRDVISDQRDDSGAAESVNKAGATLLRGEAKIVAEGVIVIDGSEVGWRDLVIATGSRPTRPNIDGLDSVPTWTSDQALSSAHRPQSLLVIGGGPVGCELSQLYARFGTHVTLVEAGPQLAAGEEPTVSERLRDILLSDGVDIRLGVEVKSVAPTPSGQAQVMLSDGKTVEVERLLLAAGRQPDTKGLGLDVLGIAVAPSGPIEVDDTGRVRGRDNVWAAGDVTGIGPFTHVANYQGRLVSDNLLGGTRRADYRAIPRAIYTDPPVASVGRNAADAADAGIEVISASLDLDEVARATTEGGPSGVLVLIADREHKVIVGASAIGPRADEWLAEMTLAIRAQIPIGILADVIHAFPTFAEAYEPLFRQLVEQTNAHG